MGEARVGRTGGATRMGHSNARRKCDAAAGRGAPVGPEIDFPRRTILKRLVRTDVVVKLKILLYCLTRIRDALV